jgi:hypothetical protein
VASLLRGYFQIGDRDEPCAIREKVTGKLLTLDRTLEPVLPALLALLDVPVEDRQWEALDPPARRQRTIDALRRLLLRESQVQPLLVVFEDLEPRRPGVTYDKPSLRDTNWRSRAQAGFDGRYCRLVASRASAT